MKKIICLFVCLFVGFLTPFWGSGGLYAQASNGVVVSDFSVASDGSNKISFKVTWEAGLMPSLWSDSVWVFVDYQTAAGSMDRLSLEGAVLTTTPGAGTIYKPAGNARGFYVIGNARTNGMAMFSTAVTVTPSFSGNLSTAGVCVYASNYPPYFEFNPSWTGGTFTGTPGFMGMISNGSEVQLVSFPEHYTFPSGYTLHSFTDATGQPGVMSCKPLGGTLNFGSVPASVNRDVNVTFSVSSAPTPSDVTYSWSAPNFITTTGAGTSFATTAPPTPGTYPVTLTARKAGYCDLSVVHDVTVEDCQASEITLTSGQAAQTVCQGSAITNIQYTLSGSASSCTVAGLPAGMNAVYVPATKVLTISGTPGASGNYTITTSGHQAPCSAVTATGTITVNASLATPSLVTTGNQCAGTGVTFNASGGSAYDWAGAFTGSGSSKTSATTAGVYTAKVRNVVTANGITCYSAYTADVTGYVNATPPTPTLTVGANQCAGTGVTFTASGGTSYEWTGAFNGQTGTATTKTSSTATGGYTTSVRNVVTANGITCYSAYTADKTGTINAKPTVSVSALSISGAACSGAAGTGTMSASATAGSGSISSYHWYVNNSSQGTTTSNTKATPSLAANATYYVIVTNSNGCTAQSSSANITINCGPPSTTTSCNSATLTVAKTDAPSTMNWASAGSYCSGLGSGWRLPTRAELTCMYNAKASIGGFVASYYWSSEEYPTNSSNAYIVALNVGSVGYVSKTANQYVRCVR